MPATEQPQRPHVPPAKDPNRPRPYERIATENLRVKAAEISAEIKTMQARLESLQATRLEFWLELERRSMSYRAIAKDCGVSNVAVKRMLDRHEARRGR